MNPILDGIILAGGKSSRMGRNKALLPIRRVPLIQHIVHSLQGICRSITVVLADEPESTYSFLEQVQFVRDAHPGKGPIAGIHAGLQAISTEYGFVMACDMPLFSKEVFDLLQERLPGPDAVMAPMQPFHAIYHKRVWQQAEVCLRDNHLRMTDLLKMIRVEVLEEISPAAPCFVNLNTPDDVESFKN